MAVTPIRRVVTGNDASGKSKVAWDGPAPSVHDDSHTGAGRGHIDFWVWNDPLIALNGATDDGNLGYDFPGPVDGGHWRVVQGPPVPRGYDRSKDPLYVPPHEAKRHGVGPRWDRGGSTSHSGGMHKTETVDYAIILDGQRTLVLDSGKVTWQPGDIVIDVGAWHQWLSESEDAGGRVAFDMIAARFPDGPVGLIQGDDKPLQPPADRKLPAGVTPVRRIVIADREPWKSCVISDGPCPDIRLDPARPGYAVQRMWVTEGTPCRIVAESLHLPNVLVPPPAGSVMNVINLPPDESWKGKVDANDVRAWYTSVGASEISTYSASGKHPYTQKSRTADFVIVQEGEVVLVLDTEEVRLSKGDFIVVRGQNHAWSNRTSSPAVLAVASHDGKA
ncbi:MAG TPA: cupin domain-containing protein [Burkholderiales bacterium]|nr:cupin domain-containing protein [Burkholderiales bacterium]